MVIAKKQTGTIFSKTLGCYVYVELSGDRLESVDFRLSGELKKLQITDDLERYFSGKPVDFVKYDVCLEGFTPFEQAVLNETRKIPCGDRITYAELADRVKHPGAARAVGNALSKNPVPIVVPCHRVVGKYNIGGYSQDIEIKKRLLKIECLYSRDS
ncbi:MAG: methylated-DNA--[protein]-cysteine S-methyltransferase [Methanocellales archaeon]|nr:methylated-DNA--[protein]-cysteine S-methyltransferase [Methanocellales archaeon]